MAEQSASATESAANRLARRDGGTANSGNNGDPFSVATLRAELERGAEAARRCADPTPMMLPKAPAPHVAVVGTVGTDEALGKLAAAKTHGATMVEKLTEMVRTLTQEINDLRAEHQAAIYVLKQDVQAEAAARLTLKATMDAWYANALANIEADKKLQEQIGVNFTNITQIIEKNNSTDQRLHKIETDVAKMKGDLYRFT